MITSSEGELVLRRGSENQRGELDSWEMAIRTQIEKLEELSEPDITGHYALLELTPANTETQAAGGLAEVEEGSAASAEHVVLQAREYLREEKATGTRKSRIRDMV